MNSQNQNPTFWFWHLKQYPGDSSGSNYDSEQFSAEAKDGVLTGTEKIGNYLDHTRVSTAVPNDVQEDYVVLGIKLG